MTREGTPARRCQPDSRSALGSAELGSALERDHDAARLARGGAINGLGSIANALCSFAFTLVVARGLEASGAGVLFQAVGIVAILIPVCQLGAASGIVHSVARQLALGRSYGVRRIVLGALVPTVVLASLLAAVLVIAPDFVAQHVMPGSDRSQALEYVRVVGASLPAAVALAILLAGTRAFGSMVPTSLIDLTFKPAVRLALVFVVIDVLHSHSAIAVGAAWTGPAVAAVVLAAYAVRRNFATLLIHGSARASVREAPLRAFWAFALPQTLSGVMQAGVQWLDVVLVGVFASSYQAGIYGALSRFLVIGTLALSAVAVAIGPQMSGLIARKEIARADALYGLSTAWAAAIAVPAYVVMALFAPVVLRIFGHQFAAGGTPLTILAIAMLANIGTGPVLMILLMGGGSRAILLDSGLAFGANVGLNVILIPLYGMTGAAISWAVSIVLMNGLAAWQVWRRWRIHPFKRVVGLIAAAAGISFGVSCVVFLQVLGSDILSLAMACVAGVAVYAGALWCLRGWLGAETLLGGALLRRTPRESRNDHRESFPEAARTSTQ